MENDAVGSDFESSAESFRPEVASMIRIAHALENGGNPTILLDQMNSLKAPDHDIPSVLKNLRQIDQSTLTALLAGRGEWIPLMLDALSDRKLANILKVVFGTFCTDVLPPSITGFGESISQPSLFPGRSACGGTNLQPLFDILSETPVSTIKKALPIIRRSDTCDEDAPYYVTYLSGIKYRRPKSDGGTAEIFFELTRRIPTDVTEREALIAARASSLVLDYFNRAARTTVASEPAFRHLRALICAHAESSGFPSINSALLDFARRWFASPTLEVDGYTLHKSHDIPEGVSVIKGGKKLRNLPASLRKNDAVTLFRAEAFALWQTRLSFEDEALAWYIESGEMLENQEFLNVFGCQPSSTIQKRLTTRVPENLEKEILDVLKSNVSHDFPLACIPPVSPAETFPEMIRRGWEHFFSAKGVYGGIYSQYRGPGETTNIVIGLKPLNPREQPKEGLTPPETLQTLTLMREVRLQPVCSPMAPSNERVLGLILRDLVEVFQIDQK